MNTRRRRAARRKPSFYLVARDGGRWTRAGDGDVARSLAVTVDATSSYAGRLVVRELDGTEATRPIAGENCDDVVRSLAVLVALSFEPPATPPAPATLQVRSAPTEEPPVPDEPRTPGWRLGVSLEETLSGGANPGPRSGARRIRRALLQGPHVFAPAIRLGTEISPTFTLTERSANLFSTGYTRFHRWVVRLDACPLQSQSAQPWASGALNAELCVRGDLGALTSEGQGNGVNAAGTRNTWAAVGTLLRIRSISSGFFVDAEGGVLFPLVRDRFVADFTGTPTQVFAVPVAAVTMGLGIGAFLF